MDQVKRSVGGEGFILPCSKTPLISPEYALSLEFWAVYKSKNSAGRSILLGFGLCTPIVLHENCTKIHAKTEKGSAIFYNNAKTSHSRSLILLWEQEVGRNNPAAPDLVALLWGYSGETESCNVKTCIFFHYSIFYSSDKPARFTAIYCIRLKKTMCLLSKRKRQGEVAAYKNRQIAELTRTIRRQAYIGLRLCQKQPR